MKPTFITLLCISPLFGMAQISGQMRMGYNASYKQWVISPAIDFAAYNIHLTTEMIVNPGHDKPASFGAKIGYEVPLFNQWSAQGGAGKYFNLYSTDSYDKYKNEWVNLFYVSVKWNRWFIEYDYVNGGVFTIGVREQLSNLK